MKCKQLQIPATSWALRAAEDVTKDTNLSAPKIQFNMHIEEANLPESLQSFSSTDDVTSSGTLFKKRCKSL